MIGQNILMCNEVLVGLVSLVMLKFGHSLSFFYVKFFFKLTIFSIDVFSVMHCQNKVFSLAFSQYCDVFVKNKQGCETIKHINQ